MKVRCKQCEIEFDKHPNQIKKTNNNFCTKSCAATYNNKKYPKKQHTIRIDAVGKTCKNCEKLLDFSDHHYNKLYCGLPCHHAFQRKQKDASIEAAGGLPNKMAIKTFKDYLVRKWGAKCQICGLTEWNEKTVPLVLDHINGDSTNSIFENLRLVCGNCDMQLPTYKSKNKNSDRKRK